MNLSISFNSIDAGWANCEVFVDNERFIITASYLDDALGNLAAATLKMAEGDKSAHAIFAEEPGEYKWMFSRLDEKEISVEILWFDDWLASGASISDGRMILSFQCSLLTFVRRIIICLGDVLNEYGLEGYKKKWINNEFPLKVYNELRNILPTLR